MSARLLPALRRCAAPLVVATGLWLLDRRPSAIAVALAAAVLLVLGVAVPAAASAIDSLVMRAGRVVASAVSYVAASLAWLIGVLPVWVLSRGRRSSPFTRRQERSGSVWIQPPPGSSRTPAGVPKASDRSGSSDTAGSGRAHPVLRALVAVGLTAALTIGIIVVGRSSATPPELAVAPAATTDATDQAAVEYDGLPVDSYAHEDEPWAPQLFGEYLQLPYRSDPFLGHRLEDFEGTYVDVVDGRRVSYTPEDPELTVWFFGGSTMFGIGQRDDHTLPSVVARLAERDGIRMNPVNFGVSGYVNWLSLQQFEQALSSGELEPPDLAVFYEGVNEIGLATERVTLGDVRPGSISRLTNSEEERELVRSAFDNRSEMDWGDERTAVEIEMGAEQYRRGAELIGHLAESFDVPVVHVWQPSPFAKRPSPADDELWRRLGADPAWLPGSTAKYHALRDRSGVDVIDLTTALDDVTRPVYFDGGHTNELGASIIGRAMYERLSPQLREIAGSS